MRYLILDTDPGIDDSVALLLLLGGLIANDDIELAGITIVHGNSGDVDMLAKNARYLCRNIANQRNIPVIKGSSIPMVLPWAGHSGADFHGQNALGDVVLDDDVEPTAEEKALDAKYLHTIAAEFIVDMCVRVHPHEVDIITVGPMTNLALALRLRPDLPSFVNSVLLMGSAIDVPGNKTPVAEANIHNDPHAARIAFQAKWRVPIVVAGLQVTRNIYLTDSDWEHIRDANAAGKFLYEVTRFYVAMQKKMGRDTMPLHDPSIVLHYLRPSLFTKSILRSIDVETASPLTMGMTVPVRGGEKNALVLLEGDLDQCRKYLFECLKHLP
eukprot:TRINITY_DN681_c2_g1_i1.p1 TRINITY_DN681_c2_g1~~TRINITY_DN681_c2_g1_i1.p1  ORF type:complete len:327 (+),score=57.55 TRINITY_DN681_c2_g1_i1:159-1139(+)